jgi:hypothetical protein
MNGNSEGRRGVLADGDPRRVNNRESLKAILEGRRPRELCQFEWGYWPETIQRWRREGMPARKEPWEAAGITFYHRVPVQTRFLPEFEPAVLEESGETQIIRDANGIVQEVMKGRTAFPRFLKHPVSSMADFEALKSRLDPQTPGRFPPDWPGAAHALENRDSILVMGGTEISFFGWPRDLMGVENLLLAFHDQPRLIHAINEHQLAFLKALYSRILRDVQFDFIFIWEDMSFKNGPLISPAMIREFMLPYYRDFISFMKPKSGCKVLVDSDGDVRALIPLFIEAGVDGMLPFECAAGMDIREIRREYPDFILCGGIDKREIARGKQAIDRELETKLPLMFERGRYLPGMDHHVPPEVSWSDFLYYLEKTRSIHRECST